MIEEAKKLINYTDDIYFLKLGSIVGYNKIIELFEYLDEVGKGEIPLNIASKIVIAYFDDKHESKNIISALLANSSFVQALKTMSQELLVKYLEAIKKIADLTAFQECYAANLLTDEEVQAYYGQLHIELVYLALKYHKNSDLTYSIIKPAITNKHSLNVIQLLIDNYKVITSYRKKIIIGEDQEDAKKALLHEIASLRNKEGLTDDDIGYLIKSVVAAVNKYDLNILGEALDFIEVGCAGLKFSKYKELLHQVLLKRPIEPLLIFSEPVLKNRAVEEVEEMLTYSSHYPASLVYFIDDDILEYMTWEEQKTLFDKYHLEKAANREKIYAPKREIMSFLRDYEDPYTDAVNITASPLYEILNAFFASNEDVKVMEEYRAHYGIIEKHTECKEEVPDVQSEIEKELVKSKTI